MPADRSKLSEIAISQVGVREVGGNNRGPEVEAYQLATWLKPGPWPWCAAFVDWCVREWLSTEYARHEPPFNDRSLSSWRPRTAGAFDLERWAKEIGLLILPKKIRCEAGDIVVYDMSHCGIVVATARADSKNIESVEGNTGPTGLRESNLGDGVFRKRRPREMIRSVIRLVLA